MPYNQPKNTPMHNGAPMSVRTEGTSMYKGNQGAPMYNNNHGASEPFSLAAIGAGIAKAAAAIGAGAAKVGTAIGAGAAKAKAAIGGGKLMTGIKGLKGSGKIKGIAQQAKGKVQGGYSKFVGKSTGQGGFLEGKPIGKIMSGNSKSLTQADKVDLVKGGYGKASAGVAAVKAKSDAGAEATETPEYASNDNTKKPMGGGYSGQGDGYSMGASYNFKSLDSSNISKFNPSVFSDLGRTQIPVQIGDASFDASKVIGLGKTALNVLKESRSRSRSSSPLPIKPTTNLDSLKQKASQIKRSEFLEKYSQNIQDKK